MNIMMKMLLIVLNTLFDEYILYNKLR